jgi:hypothetical protein
MKVLILVSRPMKVWKSVTQNMPKKKLLKMMAVMVILHSEMKMKVSRLVKMMLRPKIILKILAS